MPEKGKRNGNVIKRGSNQPRSEDKPAINPIKKRIRDLNRLLEHKDTLPADVRLNYERELASRKHDVEKATRAIRRSRMIQRYHMVRFFERKRATKLLKRARAELSKTTSPEERNAKQAAVHAFEVDLNYALFYPLHMVYRSLYAQSKDKDGINVADRDGAMWKVVEQAMASGCLQDLREGKLEGYRDVGEAEGQEAEHITQGRQTKQKQKPQKSGAVTGKSRAENDENEDEAEDGNAFFE